MVYLIGYVKVTKIPKTPAKKLTNGGNWRNCTLKISDWVISKFGVQIFNVLFQNIHLTLTLVANLRN